MPQPLLKWPNDLRFGDLVPRVRPQLSTEIARVCAAWTIVEIEIGFMLAAILDTQARPGVAMYLALSGTAAQNATLLAAAEISLSPELQAELGELLKQMRKRAKERAAVVHALWGASAEYPDALINCPPQMFVMDIIDKLHHYVEWGKDSEDRTEILKHLTSYTKNDFEQIIKRFHEFTFDVNKFSQKVSEEHVRRRALADALKRTPPSETSKSLQEAPQTNPSESE